MEPWTEIKQEVSGQGVNEPGYFRQQAVPFLPRNTAIFIPPNCRLLQVLASPFWFYYALWIDRNFLQHRFTVFLAAFTVSAPGPRRLLTVVQVF